MMLPLAFLIDVDNTLIANDEVKKNLDEHLQVEMGEDLTRRFWEIYEQVREEQSVVNIPLTLKRLRVEISVEKLDELTYQHVRSIFDNYPFFQYLYPSALETLRYLSTLGLTVIVSDGDQFFQAEKIVESSLAATVEGRVLLYVHKQQHLSEILQRYPAVHYAMIDDKTQILADSKNLLADRLTTVFVRQGKYSLEPLPEKFMPDLTVEHIGDLLNFTREQFSLI
jgi:FMN phosphatase YigB (HAD superfamily)